MFPVYCLIVLVALGLIAWAVTWGVNQVKPIEIGSERDLPPGHFQVVKTAVKNGRRAEVRAMCDGRVELYKLRRISTQNNVPQRKFYIPPRPGARHYDTVKK